MGLEFRVKTDVSDFWVWVFSVCVFFFFGRLTILGAEKLAQLGGVEKVDKLSMSLDDLIEPETQTDREKLEMEGETSERNI